MDFRNRRQATFAWPRAVSVTWNPLTAAESELARRQSGPHGRLAVASPQFPHLKLCGKLRAVDIRGALPRRGRSQAAGLAPRCLPRGHGCPEKPGNSKCGSKLRLVLPRGDNPFVFQVQGQLLTRVASTVRQVHPHGVCGGTGCDPWFLRVGKGEPTQRWGGPGVLLGKQGACNFQAVRMGSSLLGI